MLHQIAGPTDVVVVNWGLHYSKGYSGQLYSLLKQVC